MDMIIDLILDRKEGSSYSYENALKYIKEEQDIFKFEPDIYQAFLSKKEDSIKAALKSYVDSQNYNPEIKDYIDSISWAPSSGWEMKYGRVSTGDLMNFINVNGEYRFGEVFANYAINSFLEDKTPIVHDELGNFYIKEERSDLLTDNENLDLTMINPSYITTSIIEKKQDEMKHKLDEKEASQIQQDIDLLEDINEKLVITEQKADWEEKYEPVSANVLMSYINIAGLNELDKETVEKMIKAFSDAGTPLVFDSEGKVYYMEMRKGQITGVENEDISREKNPSLLVFDYVEILKKEGPENNRKKIENLNEIFDYLANIENTVELTDENATELVDYFNAAKEHIEEEASFNGVTPLYNDMNLETARAVIETLDIGDYSVRVNLDAESGSLGTFYVLDRQGDSELYEKKDIAWILQKAYDITESWKRDETTETENKFHDLIEDLISDEQKLNVTVNYKIYIPKKSYELLEQNFGTSKDSSGYPVKGEITFADNAITNKIFEAFKTKISIKDRKHEINLDNKNRVVLNISAVHQFVVSKETNYKNFNYSDIEKTLPELVGPYFNQLLGDKEQALADRITLIALPEIPEIVISAEKNQSVSEEIFESKYFDENGKLTEEGVEYLTKTVEETIGEYTKSMGHSGNDFQRLKVYDPEEFLFSPDGKLHAVVQVAGSDEDGISNYLDENKISINGKEVVFDIVSWRKTGSIENFLKMKSQFFRNEEILSAREKLDFIYKGFDFVKNNKDLHNSSIINDYYASYNLSDIAKRLILPDYNEVLELITDFPDITDFNETMALFNGDYTKFFFDTPKKEVCRILVPYLEKFIKLDITKTYNQIKEKREDDFTVMADAEIVNKLEECSKEELTDPELFEQAGMRIYNINRQKQSANPTLLLRRPYEEIIFMTDEQLKQFIDYSASMKPEAFVEKEVLAGRTNNTIEGYAKAFANRNLRENLHWDADKLRMHRIEFEKSDSKHKEYEVTNTLRGHGKVYVRNESGYTYGILLSGNGRKITIEDFNNNQLDDGNYDSLTKELKEALKNGSEILPILDDYGLVPYYVENEIDMNRRQFEDFLDSSVKEYLNKQFGKDRTYTEDEAKAFRKEMDAVPSSTTFRSLYKAMDLDQRNDNICMLLKPNPIPSNWMNSMIVRAFQVNFQGNFGFAFNVPKNLDGFWQAWEMHFKSLKFAENPLAEKEVEIDGKIYTAGKFIYFTENPSESFACELISASDDVTPEDSRRTFTTFTRDGHHGFVMTNGNQDVMRKHPLYFYIRDCITGDHKGLISPEEADRLTTEELYNRSFKYIEERHLNSDYQKIISMDLMKGRTVEWSELYREEKEEFEENRKNSLLISGNEWSDIFEKTDDFHKEVNEDKMNALLKKIKDKGISLPAVIYGGNEGGKWEYPKLVPNKVYSAKVFDSIIKEYDSVKTHGYNKSYINVILKDGDVYNIRYDIGDNLGGLLAREKHSLEHILKEHEEKGNYFLWKTEEEFNKHVDFRKKVVSELDEAINGPSKEMTINDTNRVYFNPHSNEYFTIDFEDNDWHYCFYDKDLNLCSDDVGFSGSNPKDINEAIETVLDMRYDLSHSDPDNPITSYEERAQEKQHFEIENWTQLDVPDFMQKLFEKRKIDEKEQQILGEAALKEELERIKYTAENKETLAKASDYLKDKLTEQFNISISSETSEFIVNNLLGVSRAAQHDFNGFFEEKFWKMEPGPVLAPVKSVNEVLATTLEGIERCIDFDKRNPGYYSSPFADGYENGGKENFEKHYNILKETIQKIKEIEQERASVSNEKTESVTESKFLEEKNDDVNIKPVASIDLAPDKKTISFASENGYTTAQRKELMSAGFRFSTISQSWKSSGGTDSLQKLLEIIKKEWNESFEECSKKAETLIPSQSEEKSKRQAIADFSKIENTKANFIDNIRFINENYPQYKGNLTHILADIVTNAAPNEKGGILAVFRGCKDENELNIMLKEIIYKNPGQAISKSEQQRKENINKESEELGR